VSNPYDASGFGITISYWKDVAAAAAWKQDFEHLAAQRAGREQWYQQYALRICTVERQSVVSSD